MKRDAYLSSSSHLLGSRRGLAKNIGPQLLARDSAIRGLFDGNAAFGRDAWIRPARFPITHHRLTYAEFFGEGGHTPGEKNCFVECVHRDASSRFVFLTSTPTVLDGKTLQWINAA